MPYLHKRTRIGSRRDRVNIQALATTDDGMGGKIPATALGWRTVGHASAHVEALDERTKESLAAQEITATHGYHVDIRYRTGIVPQMRLEWRDKTLEIQTAVDDTGKKERLMLLCTEVQGVTASA